MDGMYFIFQLSKYFTRIFGVLAISFLIFIYFVTLNVRKSEDVVTDGASSPNRKMLLSTFEERVERDEYSVNKGEIVTSCASRNFVYNDSTPFCRGRGITRSVVNLEPQ